MPSSENHPGCRAMAPALLTSLAFANHNVLFRIHIRHFFPYFLLCSFEIDSKENPNLPGKKINQVEAKSPCSISLEYEEGYYSSCHSLSNVPEMLPSVSISTAPCQRQGNLSTCNTTSPQTTHMHPPMRARAAGACSEEL